MKNAFIYLNKIPSNLRLVRLFNDFSPDIFADTVQISRTSYARYEGGLSVPGILTLYRISSLYTTSMTALTSYDETDTKKFLKSIADFSPDDRAVFNAYIHHSHQNRKIFLELAKKQQINILKCSPAASAATGRKEF